MIEPLVQPILRFHIPNKPQPDRAGFSGFSENIQLIMEKIALSKAYSGGKHLNRSGKSYYFTDIPRCFRRSGSRNGFVNGRGITDKYCGR